MRTLGALCHRSNVRSPRFRRDPFVRDVVFDHGRASAPRIAGPHMLPSTLLTVSASAEFWFRGSIAHPTRSLCTLRSRRRRRPRNTRYRAPATAYPDRSLTGRITPALPGAQAIQFFALPFGLLRGTCHPVRIRASRSYGDSVGLPANYSLQVDFFRCNKRCPAPLNPVQGFALVQSPGRLRLPSEALAPCSTASASCAFAKAASLPWKVASAALLFESLNVCAATVG
jgi:hypothetical protein